ncbi:S1C family serine protease [Thermodesulfobacteriota bacterium]
MKKIFPYILLVILATFSVTVYAEKEPERSLDAIVEIRITVPENARSAARFGTNRVASGVVIDKAGHILTIGFQTSDAETIEIVVQDGKTVTATVVGYDRDTGFGLLRATLPPQVTPMPLGRSSAVKEGDPVLAASYGGKDGVQGVMVVARKEFAGQWEYLLENAIFTAPPIVQFSGAALISRNGHLVGIGYLFSQIMIPALGVMPTNMFVPIDLLKPILSDLKLSGQSGLPPRPWLGVRTEESYGRLFVQRVGPGGPSEKAGIKAGDIILDVNNQAVHGMADFYRKVWALGEAGVDVPLSILQGARIRHIVVHSSTRQLYPQPKKTDKQPDAKL